MHLRREIEEQEQLEKFPRPPQCPSAASFDETGDAFDRIYKQSGWGSLARSGDGSTPAAASRFSQFLLKFVHERKIRTLVEAPHGDWSTGWQSCVAWPADLRYVGFDVSPVAHQFTSQCLSSYQNFGMRSAKVFLADISKESLLASAETKNVGSTRRNSSKIEVGFQATFEDPEQVFERPRLLLVKDCLQHLPNDMIQSAIEKNLKNHDQFDHVILVEDHRGTMENENTARHIEVGGYAPFDPMKPPFNLQAEVVCADCFDQVKRVYLLK